MNCGVFCTKITCTSGSEKISLMIFLRRKSFTIVNKQNYLLNAVAFVSTATVNAFVAAIYIFFSYAIYIFMVS